MSAYVHQIPFAAQGAFVWNRSTVHNGSSVKPGDAVNTEAFSSIRLRQMYDARLIVPAPGFADSPKPAYLENGRGKADQLRAEIEREESSKTATGKGDEASSVPRRAGPQARGANAQRGAKAPAPPAAKKVVKPKHKPAAAKKRRA